MAYANQTLVFKLFCSEISTAFWVRQYGQDKVSKFSDDPQDADVFAQAIADAFRGLGGRLYD